jgi:pyruvate formate lyase activating enzyme
MTPALLVRKEKCIGCGACVAACPEGVLELTSEGIAHDRFDCTACGICTGVCPAAVYEMCGRRITVDELMTVIKKDEIFFRDGGGVTFSGGEPLMQPDFLLSALAECKKLGYHRAVDTCGFVDQEALLEAAGRTSLFLYDLKHMDPGEHKRYTGADNAVILENLIALSESGAKINIRFPFMPGLNSGDENVRALAEFVSKLRGITAVNILPYHAVARGKHERWHMEYKLNDLLPPTENQLRQAASIIESYGLKAHIGG